MSKHGITLEVLETIRPRYYLVSCANSSKHGFPHELAVLAVEDLKRNVKDKGLRYTGNRKKSLRGGTIVATMEGDGKRPKIQTLNETPSAMPPLPPLPP